MLSSTDTFQWYDDSRLKSLQRDAFAAWGHDLRGDFTYNFAGQFDQIKHYNDTTGSSLIVTSQYGYDRIGRLTSLDHKNSGGTSITGYGWTYDAAGRMKSMDFTNSTYSAEDVATFGYDRTGQLLSGDRANTANDEAYAYDGAGNRTQANGATYTTQSNNRLTDDGTFTYSYDDEGNTLTKVRKSGAAADDKTVEYTWDYRNRLEKITFKRNDGTVTKTVEYFHDMFNRLTRRDIDADGAGPGIKLAEQFMHDGEEMILHGVPSSGAWRGFMRGPQPDMVLFESRDALRVFLRDHQNTIRDVVDTAGNIVNHLTIDSFGRRTAETNGNIEVMIGLGGRPYDEDTRLQNHVNRWYSVDTGRWLSEDPIGFAGGHANLYAYIGNSPTNTTDPYGLFTEGAERVYQPRKWIDTRVVTYNPTVLGPDLDKIPTRPPSGRATPKDGPEPSFGSVWWEYILPWNNPPAVDGLDSVLVGGKWTGAGTAVIAGTAAGGVAVAGYGTVTVSQAGSAVATFVRTGGGLFGSGTGVAGNQVIRFGVNATQYNHALRHVVEAGLDRAAVQAAIEADIAANATAINAGLNIRNVVVAGQQLTYNVFQLPNGILNVGRITLP